jgi:hypothetical protein
MLDAGPKEAQYGLERGCICADRVASKDTRSMKRSAYRRKTAASASPKSAEGISWLSEHDETFMEDNLDAVTDAILDDHRQWLALGNGGRMKKKHGIGTQDY